MIAVLIVNWIIWLIVVCFFFLHCLRDYWYQTVWINQFISSSHERLYHNSFWRLYFISDRWLRNQWTRFLNYIRYFRVTDVLVSYLIYLFTISTSSPKKSGKKMFSFHIIITLTAKPLPNCSVGEEISAGRRMLISYRIFCVDTITVQVCRTQIRSRSFQKHLPRFICILLSVLSPYIIINCS